MNYQTKARSGADPEGQTMPRTPGRAESPMEATTGPESAEPRPMEGMAATRHVRLEGLNAYYGALHAVRDLSLSFEPGRVTAIIGPSGCGKSTMVRCVNRMHEEIPGARSEGRVLLDGLNLYGPDIDVVAVRRAVGMVFQKPNPFPTMSVFETVASGLRFTATAGDDLED